MEDGSWWVGQSTYGDLAMHMSFVTSLKNAAFPPEYALFPGQQLSYPFLMDSLSTSFYLFGWSIQAALAIPGTLMMALYHPAALLRDPRKKPETFEDLKRLQMKIQEFIPNSSRH